MKSPSKLKMDRDEERFISIALCGGEPPFGGLRIHMPNREDNHPSGVILAPGIRWVIHDLTTGETFTLEDLWPDWRRLLREDRVPPGDYRAKRSGRTAVRKPKLVTEAFVRKVTREDASRFELATGIDRIDEFPNLVVVEAIVADGKVEDVPFMVAALAPDGTLFKGYAPDAQVKHRMFSTHLTFIPFARKAGAQKVYAKNIKDAVALARAGYDVLLKSGESVFVPDAEGWHQVDNDDGGKSIMKRQWKHMRDLIFISPEDTRFKDFEEMYKSTGKISIKKHVNNKIRFM